MPRRSTSIAAGVGVADRLLSTLPQGWPKYTLGDQVAKWMEDHFIQPNGPRAGLPFRLTEGQYRFLCWWYALDRATGEWLYHHAARRLAKGAGKSPFAALVALAEFCGPVRLKRIDRNGNCIGQPTDLPLVQIAATAESQTSNTMRYVRAFAPKGSVFVADYGVDPGKTLYYKLPEGTLQVITSSATAAEGAEASFIVADETELWTPQNGGVALDSALSDNLAKSGERMLETSNAWIPGRETVAEATYEAWLAQEEGRLKDEAGRILYDAVIAPPSTDMGDRESLRRALEFVYADCDWKKKPGSDVPDVKSVMKRIYSPRSRPDDSKRKYLNWPTAAYDAWLEKQQWDKLADPSIEVDPEEPVVLFFDGSKSKDSTALVGCTIGAGHVFTLGIWEPDPNDDKDRVDAADVDRVVERAFEDFCVVAFFADVKEWEQSVKTTWPQRYRDRLKVWASPQSRPPEPIAWDMRGHSYDFAKATEACLSEILEGAFTHDGNSAVARHVTNARRRPYRDAVAIGKESPGSPRKIDAAVCVIGARMVRRICLGSGKKFGRRRSGRVIVLR